MLRLLLLLAGLLGLLASGPGKAGETLLHGVCETVFLSLLSRSICFRRMVAQLH